MFLKQYYLGCLAHASYLIADERTKQALVVDPQRDIEQYMKDAEQGGYTIKYVALTHFHADFLAGHIELRNRAGAQIVMGSRAQAEFEVRHVQENDELDLGDVRVRILETPGHTPEGISLLVFDLTKSDTVPHAALSPPIDVWSFTAKEGTARRSARACSPERGEPMSPIWLAASKPGVLRNFQSRQMVKR